MNHIDREHDRIISRIDAEEAAIKSWMNTAKLSFRLQFSIAPAGVDASEWLSEAELQIDHAAERRLAELQAARETARDDAAGAVGDAVRECVG